MIRKGEAADSYIANPDPGTVWTIIFGSDSTRCDAAAETLATALLKRSKQASIVRVSEDDLRKSPETVEDDIIASSLFGEQKIMLVRTPTDASAKSMLSMIDRGVSTDNRVVLVARKLSKSSKLRKAAELQSVVGLQFFERDRESIEAEVLKQAESQNLDLTPDAYHWLVKHLLGHPDTYESELERLVTFLNGSDGPITEQLLSDSFDDRATATLDEAISSVLSGTCPTLSTDDASRLGTGITGLRMLQRSVVRLIDGKRLLQSGTSERDIPFKVRPPAYGNGAAQLKTQLRLWPVNQLEQILAGVYDAERRCKQAGISDTAILAHLLNAINGMAKRRQT